MREECAPCRRRYRYLAAVQATSPVGPALAKLRGSQLAGTVSHPSGEHWRMGSTVSVRSGEQSSNRENLNLRIKNQRPRLKKFGRTIRQDKVNFPHSVGKTETGVTDAKSERTQISPPNAQRRGKRRAADAGSPGRNRDREICDEEKKRF